jgi:hypothetical protein
MTAPICERAAKYVYAIRNVHKRQYAREYALWCESKRDEDPERPAELSYLAAQAVRMNLDAIYGN